MMETKKLEEIIRPARPHRVGNGFHAYGFISGVPELSQKRMDPFLILDDNAKLTLPSSDEPRGVGMHPHKEFETVRIAYLRGRRYEDHSPLPIWVLPV